MVTGKSFFPFRKTNFQGRVALWILCGHQVPTVKTEVPKHLFPPTGRVVHGNTHEFQSTLKKFEKEHHGRHTSMIIEKTIIERHHHW